MQYNEEELKEICKRNGIAYLALFGSLARNEAGENSDADLLVNYSSDSLVKGLFSHLGVAREFEKLFKRPVDLIEQKILNPKLESYITRDIKNLYEG